MSGTFDVGIVGGGIAGLAAAQQAALDGASVVHFTGEGVPGGLVANVGALEGFPATGALSALDLALAMGEANQKLGVEMVAHDAKRLEPGSRGHLVHAGLSKFTVRAVVAASGAKLKMIEAPGADRLLDKGVSQCAWCNGSLYRGRDVVVVGGGDSALQEALHLADYASLVTVVTRGEALRARRNYVERAADNERIAFRWETDVEEILGTDSVSGVRLRDRASGGSEDLDCAGVFVYVGLEPNTGWLGGTVTCDERGFVVTNDDLATSVPGVFAAGALRSGYGGKLTQAVGEATTAAMAAARHAAD